MTATRAPGGGRPLRVNLFTDGYTVAAEHVHNTVAKQRGRLYVSIKADGGVRAVRTSDYGPAEADALVLSEAYVGQYNRHAPIEDIENDLIHWLRTLSKPIAA
jgi:hypothetical protein